jgi:hypothetical protein
MPHDNGRSAAHHKHSNEMTRIGSLGVKRPLTDRGRRVELAAGPGAAVPIVARAGGAAAGAGFR